tara:strand:- start:664 stop:4965 length:4302 start_codon:yes stop_codon:yes gene_type:complete
MPNKITENDVSNISFDSGGGNLKFEINPVNDISGINKDIFIKNHGSNKNIITMTFLYNNELVKDNINNFNLKFKTENLYEGSVLIVGGGGGGGYDIGGGGGGGEVIYIDNISFKGNINYNIVVGKGGKEGTKSYYHGDSGYNSGINDIVAVGGGGGASYYAETAYSLLTKSKSKFRHLGEKGRGLDGGSGGGGCGFQYGKDDEVSTYKYGKKNNLKNPMSAFDNYYTFGNNGGVGNSYTKGEDQLAKVRGGGGGGAGEVGDNSTNEDTTHFGKGGDGIAIEKIDIKTGIIRFCPLYLPTYNGKKLECNVVETKEFVTNKIQEKLRTKVTGDEINIYWGGGGGAGSYNTKAGNGGRGGGGGGGYYEGIHDSINENNVGKRAPGEGGGEKGNSSLASAVEISQNNIDNDIAKGGIGLPDTGGGGGGGGLTSKGGNGGSGIVIIILKTKEKLIEVKSPEYTLTDIENMLSEFDNNKTEFGKNLSKLYNYNIKEHREFYDYIDHIYEDNVLKKNVPHGSINDENKVRKDLEIMKYNYDRDVYDIKFHQYLKIIFDLKINYDSFLLYSKIRDEEKFSINEKLYDYQRLMIIILDIIENIIILIRNDKKYYELINNTDILEIALLNDKRKTYNLKEDLSELDNDIEFLNIQLIEINNDIYNLEQKEKDGENTKTQQDALKITKTNLEERKRDKETEKKIKIEADLYYNYSEIKIADKKTKILKLYISDNNNFEIYNTNSQTTENLLKEQLFEYYKINTINLKKILEYKDIKELIKGENDTDNDIQLIIKIYIYSLLKIKKQNFIKNILSLYIYMSYGNILHNFYKESEEFLLGNNIINYTKDKEKTLCKSTLYNNLQKIDNTIDRMKSLLGYSFINEYINDYKINEANLISSSCPYVKIELNDYDSNAIILMLFRKTKNDNLILNCDVDDAECHSKEKLNLLKYKDYYKNLKESFLIEIDNNRYSIHDFNFRKENTHDEKIVDIIEFIIDDRYSKICKTSVEKKIKDIYILSKDSSHINDIYENDISLLDKYSENVEKQKKELDNINEKYNKYKYHYEKSKYKYNIYYFILFLILIVIIILNITGTNSYMKTITYLIILSVLTILIIYNHFTKVNLTIVEKFTKYEEEKEQIFYDYYDLVKAIVETNNPNLDSVEYYDIKLQLDEVDKYKLKIRKFKNIQKNTDGYVNKLVKDNLRIYYNNRIENITNVIITDDDPHYYYITNITFKHNNKVDIGPITDVVLLKHDESIIEKLLKDKNYKTITGETRDNLCHEVCKTTEELNTLSTEEKLEIKNKKKIYIYTVRNDILRYINNKFININKIIESIELEKANNLSNKVHKSLTNEKKNLLNYQKQYDSKKLKNINVNNLYKHEIIGQSAFINFIIIFSFILILLLLLVNIFPTKILVIMIIGFIFISCNIYNYILNSSYNTRKDANKKYW